MSVVFDEVITTVETSQPAAPERDASEERDEGPDNTKHLGRLMETQQRRARRLWAD